jgi:hypothetical protein
MRLSSGCKEMPVVLSLLALLAKLYYAVFMVTRNIQNFLSCELELINPRS